MALHMLGCSLRYHSETWAYGFDARIAPEEADQFVDLRAGLRNASARRTKSRELIGPQVRRVGEWLVPFGSKSPIDSPHWKKGEKRCWAVKLRRDFTVFFMYNGDLLGIGGTKTRAMPGGVKKRKADAISDKHDDNCMHCPAACCPDTSHRFVCCEEPGCRNSCCPACASTIDPHARLALQQGDDYYCTECRRKVEASDRQLACGADGCEGCRLEFEATQQIACKLKLYHTGEGWISGCTVSKFWPAHVPTADDEQTFAGQTFAKSWWLINVPGHGELWIELTKSSHFVEVDTVGRKSVFTAGWQLEQCDPS